MHGVLMSVCVVRRCVHVRARARFTAERDWTRGTEKGRGNYESVAEQRTGASAPWTRGGRCVLPPPPPPSSSRTAAATIACEHAALSISVWIFSARNRQRIYQHQSDVVFNFENPKVPCLPRPNTFNTIFFIPLVY